MTNRAGVLERDEAIIKLGRLGLSQSLMASTLGCSTATISQRLKLLGIDNKDARRSLMDTVILHLSVGAREWVSTEVEKYDCIEELITELFEKAYKDYLLGDTP